MNRTPSIETVLLLLTRIREEQGLSQANVVELTAMTQPNLSQIENGKRRLAITEFLELLDCYGVSPVEFFTRLQASSNETEPDLPQPAS